LSCVWIADSSGSYEAGVPDNQQVLIPGVRGTAGPARGRALLPAFGQRTADDDWSLHIFCADPAAYCFCPPQTFGSGCRLVASCVSNSGLRLGAPRAGHHRERRSRQRGSANYPPCSNSKVGDPRKVFGHASCAGEIVASGKGIGATGSKFADVCTYLRRQRDGCHCASRIIVDAVVRPR
jgi:hypothetical protein